MARAALRRRSSVGRESRRAEVFGDVLLTAVDLFCSTRYHHRVPSTARTPRSRISSRRPPFAATPRLRTATTLGAPHYKTRTTTLQQAHRSITTKIRFLTSRDCGHQRRPRTTTRAGATRRPSSELRRPSLASTTARRSAAKRWNRILLSPTWAEAGRAPVPRTGRLARPSSTSTRRRTGASGRPRCPDHRRQH